MRTLTSCLCLSLLIVSASWAGIADGYVRDAGIAGHPSVVFADNFEAAIATIRASYNGYQADPSAISVSSDVPTASGGTQSVLMTPSGSASQLFRQLGAEYDTLCMRVYIKFAGDSYHHSGAGMGGYLGSATYPVNGFPYGDAGLKGIRDDGLAKLINYDFETQGAANEADPDTSLDTYINWIDMPGTCCGGPGAFFGRRHLLTEAVPIRAGTWQSIESCISLNTTADGHEGTLKIYIDGSLIADFRPGNPVGAYDSGSGFWTTGAGSGFPGFQWRDTLTYGLNWIKLQNFDDIGAATEVRFDDLVVATEYIGPMSLTGTTPPRFDLRPNLRAKWYEALSDLHLLGL